jgi:hypothetical protein
MAELPKTATRAHIVPALQNHDLFSLGQLCDAGCTATIDKKTIDIKYNDKTVITGTRSEETTLWHLDDVPHNMDKNDMFPIYGNAATTTNTPANIVAFTHAAFFSPALSTLEQALAKNYITNIPGFTLAALKKYPPQSSAMIKGHMDQTRKNIRSTKTNYEESDETDDLFPIQLTSDDMATNHYCYASIFEPTGKMYADLTGTICYPSSNGNNTVVVLYDYDSNAILAEPIKNRKAASILEAYKKMHTTLKSKGMTPKLQILDNECSNLLKAYFNNNNIKYQLAPPGQHRTNAAERAIRTFKNHFIAGLCSVDEFFPMHLWDRLLPQALLTLNLLRGSRINPHHSAQSQLFGHYDFNAHPIAPPGIRVIVHVKPDQRGTWDPHGIDAWYTGYTTEHYRSFKVWTVATNTERITDTLAWFPRKVIMPTATSTELVVALLKDVTHELQNQKPKNSIINISDTNTGTLRAITEALTNIVTDTSDDYTTDWGNLNDTAPVAPPVDAIEPTAAQRVVDNNTTTNQASQRVATTNATTNASLKPCPAQSPTLPPFEPVYRHPTNVSKSPIDAAHANNLDNWPDPRIVESIIKRQGHQHNTRSSARAMYIDKIHFACYGNAINPDTGLPAEYPELIKSSDGEHWVEAGSEEIGRLTNGNGTTMPTGTGTMEFMYLHEMPKGAKITYARIVVADRPEKPNPRRVRLTIGGDRITYDGVTSTKAAELPTAKLFFNSVVSTPKAKFMTIDIKDFFLQTARMAEKNFAYMKIALNVIPADIITKYNLHDKAIQGFVYVRVVKGMYGLPQAGRLANDQLIEKLAPFGYAPCKFTPGLWKHATRDISFLLVVDDFGVKYTNRSDAEHLITALETAYKISTDWDGERYIGLTLKWDYYKRTCDISMPGFIERALARFNHPTPKKPQHNPSTYYKPEYGAKVQYSPDADTSPLLNDKDKKRIQEILGTLLYYARACDNTILQAISSLASQQSTATQNTQKQVHHLLDYCATHPNATIRYIACDMVLHLSSDASYNSELKAKSRSAGFHYLSQRPGTQNIMEPTLNGAVLITSTIITETVASAAEAELAALFHNARDALPLIRALEELGHPQPPTPIQCDNSTAVGISNDSVKQKMAKFMDMRYYWIQDQVKLKQYNIYWNKGQTNLADYFTKQHPTIHHQEIRSVYLFDENNPNNGLEFFHRTKLKQAAALSATCSDSSDSTSDCAKGVLISYSGLHSATSSEDTVSYVLFDQQSHAYVISNIDEQDDVYGEKSVAHTIDTSQLQTHSYS